MTLSRLIICAVLVLPLAACGAARNALPSEEVLRNAALHAPSLQSARFDAQATLRDFLPEFAPVTVVASGILTDGGQQIAFDIDATSAVTGMDAPAHMQAAVTVGGEHDVYVRFDALEGPLLQAIVSPDAQETWIGRWWKLPPTQDVQSPAISPDPSLLRMQADVLTVVRDRGIVAVDGADAYHYDVQLDPVKLRTYLQAVAEAKGESLDAASLDAHAAAVSGTGEVWIDAESFFLRRVRWSLQGVEGLSADVDVRLSQINAAGPVVLPESAEPFPMTVDQLLPSAS